MNIKEYCNTLYKFWKTSVSKNKKELEYNTNKDNFVKELLSAAVNNEGKITNDNNQELTDNYELALLNQDADISRITGVGYISKENLKDILGMENIESLTLFIDDITNNISLDRINDLCKAFENEVGPSTPSDISEKLANLFFHILKNLNNENNQSTMKTSMPTDLIYEQISEIIGTLSKQPIPEQDKDLSYISYKVNQKIEPSNQALLKDITNNAILYYSFIKELFANVSDSRFMNDFSKLVKSQSDKYIHQGYPQEMVYEKMV